MLCVICKRVAKVNKTCLTCKSYHPSCLKEALKFKPPTNCCVISFKAPLSPLKVTANSSRRTSFVRSTSQRSSLSSFKSIDSSPKTPPISTVLEDSVFTSSAMDQQSLTTRSKTTSSSDSGKMNETIGTSQESSSLNDKPDWTNFTLDQKMNLLLDMSFKNSFEIRKVSQDLSQHTEDIKTIMTTLNKNSADIKSLSTNLNTINNSLAKVREKQKSTDEKVNKITQACNENFTAIDLINSTLDSIGSVNNISSVSSNASSSQLLLSGVPEQITSNLSAAEIVHHVFNKLSISNLENDILSVKELRNRNPPTSHGLRHSFVLNLKSCQLGSK
ncbi:hypothetical protein KQX54_009889 [Cotesia glomerata]|uniref:Phorbol-ester/DAG-type domain-containing protein n=1 Tax=Cotesia glomerata TaxID=32391 RepID=A0AAV7ITM5_COTGL|nr:hypothetical protein KQX54_009889 [Cotesia glomerata]